MPAAQFNRLCALCCTHHLAHTGNYCQLFPLAWTPIWQHIGMCLGDKFDGLILSAYARFDPSCCWTKIAPPVPTCNSPFTFTHDSCVEHYLSLLADCIQKRMASRGADRRCHIISNLFALRLKIATPKLEMLRTVRPASSLILATSKMSAAVPSQKVKKQMQNEMQPNRAHLMCN